MVVFTIKKTVDCGFEVNIEKLRVSTDDFFRCLRLSNVKEFKLPYRFPL